MKTQLALWCNPDTVGYLDHLKREWNVPSKSEVVEILVRKRWKGDQVRTMKAREKLEKQRTAA